MTDARGPDRPDEEPTINEAGSTGFAIDGTDSFAVPPLAAGAAPEVGDEPEGTVLVSRRRIAATLAAAILLLVAVVALGSSGDDDDRLAGDDEVREVSSVPTTAPTAADAPFRLSPDDAETLARLEAAGESDPTMYDEMYPVDTTDTFSSDPFATDESYDPFDEFDDEFDDSYSDDDYIGRYVPSVTRPRTFPTTPRRIVPTTPGPATDTATTAAPVTVTTSPPTETTASITTTTTATTTPAPTTVAPTRSWEPATTGLELRCGDGVRLWPLSGSLVAAVDGRGLFTTRDGATWTALAGSRDVARAVALTESTTGDRLWAASDRGVFEVTSGTASEVGDLRAVTSLSGADGTSGPVLLAVSNGEVQRWEVGTSTAWAPLAAALPTGAVPGAVLAIDGQTALIGTDKGVLRTTDGGQMLSPVSTETVVGAPVRADANLWWLRAGGAGVLFSGDAGATWTTVNGSGIATAATALAQVPGVGLVTTGTAANVVASADAGATWTALDPAAPFRPDSIAHSAAAKATFIATSDCATGTPADASDSVLRLRDAAP